MIELILCLLVTFSITSTLIYLVYKSSNRIRIKKIVRFKREQFLIAIYLPLVLALAVLFIGQTFGLLIIFS
tara:strand:+ start:238 stop:450 length:213 start_codon:yes stop_codon:yes gene_type:complete